METRSRQGAKRRLSRAAQVAQNRDALLSAAGRVFRRSGYVGSSLEAIAEEAGFSKGVIYSQFDSKADLFLTLLEQRIEERARDARTTALPHAKQWGTAGLAEYVFSQAHSDPAWRLAVLEFRVIAARDPVLNARYAEAHRQTVAGVADVIAEFFEAAGVVPGLPLETLALVGVVFDVGGFLENLAAPGVLSEAQLADLFVRVAGAVPEAPPDGRRQKRRKT
jgi:AcrR family transcriptional regulator